MFGHANTALYFQTWMNVQPSLTHVALEYVQTLLVVTRALVPLASLTFWDSSVSLLVVQVM